MDIILVPLLGMILILLKIYFWIVFIAVVMSWLIMFGIINTSHDLVYRIRQIVYQLTEPVFSQIRKYIPPIGGLDLSPLFVLVLLWGLETAISMLIAKISTM